MRDKMLVTLFVTYIAQRGGLMISSLDSGSSGPGSSPGRGHSWERKVTLTVPPHTQVYK